MNNFFIHLFNRKNHARLCQGPTLTHRIMRPLTRLQFDNIVKTRLRFEFEIVDLLRNVRAAEGTESPTVLKLF